ncbi:uncharacterized protein CCOS01_09639 [Colletotrichum costaricense]|uniref:Uncharacterized protein n=1 Tax=Colletotrichum costaricense TaxID=1209916 RepID=A0AAI9YSZ0_9PEZI|nr:uncharacterized protein CCOS01_09639 [Colletotrichum costaricense]KAK1521927.1 hypothetical protein CCOS01_09639 [Colletotrichum costaricense]
MYETTPTNRQSGVTKYASSHRCTVGCQKFVYTLPVRHLKPTNYVSL